MRPDGFFVSGRVGRRAELAAQARPYGLFFGSCRPGGPNWPIGLDQPVCCPARRQAAAARVAPGAPRLIRGGSGLERRGSRWSGGLGLVDVLHVAAGSEARKRREGWRRAPGRWWHLELGGVAAEKSGAGGATTEESVGGVGIEVGSSVRASPNTAARPGAHGRPLGGHPLHREEKRRGDGSQGAMAPMGSGEGAAAVGSGREWA
jgi:hypothetical protein